MPLLHPLRGLLSKLRGRSRPSIAVRYVVDRPGWLRAHLPPPTCAPPPVPDFRIEERALWTERLGPQPLWEGYSHVEGYPKPTSGSMRSSNQVRTDQVTGSFFHWLARTRRPGIVVEFGTAFGVSGMYWLSAIEQNGAGQLLTFEPNSGWAQIADQNLAAIGRRYRLTTGTFEENIGAVLEEGQRIDIAFVDAIHTSAFIHQQFELLLPRMTAGGIVLFDDIAFSEDMRAGWQEIARDPRVHASAALGSRIGIVELRAA